MKVSSFPPIATARARVLILGTMPGVRSLQEQRYYAHKQNAFWPIMSELFDAPIATYAQRVALVKKNNLALWDVLKHCHRPGSLDADITGATPNDFKKFLRAHPCITHIFFNGQPAARLFERHVDLPTAELTLMTLPSTSPAHATLTRAKKLTRWRAIQKALSE